MTSSSRKSGIKLNRPFVGIPSFLRAPIVTDLGALDADIAVYGVPFDEGSPFLAGSRMGPRSIREHSLRFAASDAGFYDPESGRTYLAHEMTNRTIADVGDVDVWPTDVKSSFDNATDLTKAVLARGALPVVLGGDHSVTYPIVKGFEDEEAAARHPLRRPHRLCTVHPRSPLHQRACVPSHRPDGACAEPRPGRNPQPQECPSRTSRIRSTTAAGW